MRVGVILPQLEIGSDPGAIRAYAQGVEELGFAHLLAYEHVLGADTDRDDPRMAAWPPTHYDIHDDFHEPFVLFGFLAGVTTTLEFATGVMILPQRQAALVAKQALELQQLSRGRLRLGVGLGWNQFEYESLGEDWGVRGRKLDEQLVVLRKLWDEPMVDFEGDFHVLPRVGLRPLDHERIPLWLGGTSAPAFRRAARFCDGWVAPAGPTTPVVRESLAGLRQALEAVGRDPDSFGIDGRVDSRFRDDEDVARDLEAWRELGVSHVSVHTMTPADRRDEPMGPDEHLERLRSIAPLIG